MPPPFHQRVGRGPADVVHCPRGQQRGAFWPSSAAGYELQQNPDLNPTNWTTYLGPVTVSGNTTTATLPVPSGPFFSACRAQSLARGGGIFQCASPC